MSHIHKAIVQTTGTHHTDGWLGSAGARRDRHRRATNGADRGSTTRAAPAPDPGDFAQTLVGNRLRVNVSPDLSVASYVQYDTDSNSVGVNTRLRWTFSPFGDLFVVYNHNVRELMQSWQFASNQLLVKVQYAFRR